MKRDSIGTAIWGINVQRARQ